MSATTKRAIEGGETEEGDIERRKDNGRERERDKDKERERRLRERQRVTMKAEPTQQLRRGQFSARLGRGAVRRDCCRHA
jgi:hypothetical protein